MRNPTVHIWKADPCKVRTLARSAWFVNFVETILYRISCAAFRHGMLSHAGCAGLKLVSLNREENYLHSISHRQLHQDGRKEGRGKVTDVLAFLASSAAFCQITDMFLKNLLPHACSSCHSMIQ